MFGVFLSAFCIQYLLQQNEINIPIIHAYMDDLICIPVILFPLLLLFRKFVYPFQQYVFPVTYIVITWSALCFVFEIYLPAKSIINTYDPIDMILYGIGGVIYYFMQLPFSKKRVLVN